MASSLSLLLLLAYPPAVHWGLMSGQVLPALVVLAALLLLPSLLTRHLPGVLLGGAVLAGLALLGWSGVLAPWQLFYLPPVAILLVLWWLFARTLLPGQRPLVTRIAALTHERLSPALLRYTRAVTWVWVGVLSLLMVQVLWLAYHADPLLWSLFANFLNYLILAAIFLIEFAMRRVFLPAEDRLGAVAFFRFMRRIRLHKL